jgi:hypothetical protein
VTRLTGLIAVAATGALVGSLAAGRAAGAQVPPPGPHLVLSGTAAGGALRVTPEPGHAGPGRAALPLEARIFGRGGAGRPLVAAPGPAGYTPAQLRAYLRLRDSGLGQTVTVVDAFDDPYITRDVNTFSTRFGLPRVCGTRGAGTGCFPFAVRHPDGFAGVDTGWGLETSLDVELIHAIAPRAAIVLMEARDDTVGSMFAAIGHAAALRPDAISNSWTFGGPEFTGETRFDHYCRLAASLCVFAAGDTGYPGFYPAYSPDVLAIGGTTLKLARDGTVTSEVAWNSADGATGGGLSYIEPRPGYQKAVNPASRRGIPDVSFDADPATGMAVYDSEISNGSAHWFEVGGTSAGAPAWSAILAVAGQLRAAAGLPRLTEANFAAQRAVYSVRYGHGLYDVTRGTNGPVVLCGPQCRARRGYDYVTGLGTPRPGIDLALGQAAAAPSAPGPLRGAPGGRAPGSGLGLSDVSCTSASFCEAIGGSNTALLAERWNGSTWTRQSMPAPSGGSGPQPAAVSCTAANACEAVGYFTNKIGATQPMVEHWNGTAWKVQAVLAPGGKDRGDGRLLGVSCPRTNFCEAVGAYLKNGFGPLTLAEAWNGTTWQQQPVPHPGIAGAAGNALTGVSCAAAGDCEAVGFYTSSATFAITTLAVVWNGSAWKQQPAPNPSSKGNSLTGVSCPAANRCEAVGDDGNNTSNLQAFALVWNGTSWSEQAVDRPAAAANLLAVSCAAADACEAVGEGTVLAEGWNGTSWAAQSVPDSTVAILNGVSCPAARTCEAVGAKTGSASGLLAEVWNGTTWTIQPTP